MRIASLLGVFAIIFPVSGIAEMYEDKIAQASLISEREVEETVVAFRLCQLTGQCVNYEE